MNIELKDYTLPDAYLLNGKVKDNTFIFWKPEFLCLVLGSSNRLEQAVYVQKVLLHKIPVYRRPSGGETILLSPKTLVISAVKFERGFLSVKNSFRYFNQRIIQALQSLGVKNLVEKGVSDLTIGDQKILGSAIYRNKDRMFYHAVLNVNESSRLIANYIRYPRREPDYRISRKHEDFVTSLAEQGYDFRLGEIKEQLKVEFSKNRSNG
jgi:lipoate-protein ligase A